MNIETELRRSFKERRSLPRTRSGSLRPWIGIETRYHDEGYFWDGLKRPAGSQHGSEIVYQVTLDGEGCYATESKTWRLPPRHAFLAYIPSAHKYYLPGNARKPWTFFWMIIEHPYVVQRLQSLNKRRGEVVRLSSLELSASVNLFKQTCAGNLDEIGQEQALFNWCFELERAGKEEMDAAGPDLFEWVIRYTQENIHRSFGIEELADEVGLSRSHFTRKFQSLTGKSPAAVVLNCRLGEVAQLLADSTLTLAQIARATGFADAKHLGKAFKRNRGVTPGQFRLSRTSGQLQPRGKSEWS